jgi:hypothetical protein
VCRLWHQRLRCIWNRYLYTYLHKSQMEKKYISSEVVVAAAEVSLLSGGIDAYFGKFSEPLGLPDEKTVLGGAS